MKSKYNNLENIKFGKLLTKSLGPKSFSQVRYNCICECGNKTLTSAYLLVKGVTKSCGCTQYSHQKPFGYCSMITIYNGYKRDAKKRHLIFDLSVDNFSKITKENCHYCGVEPQTKRHQKNSYGFYIYNGIDRVNNDIGYILSNCVACCKICNIAKNNLSYSDFKLWIKRLIDFNANI